MSEHTTELTSANFDDFIGTDTPALVDFWAEWCGPCKMIGPIVDEVAAELGANGRIGKLNVDNHNDIPAKFGIRGIPTLMIFKNGQVIATKVGAVSKAQLLEFIDENK